MNVVIRRATRADADRLAALKRGWGTGSASDIIAFRLAEAAQERAVYLLAEQDGAVAGHVFLKFGGKPTAPDYPDIEDLYVAPGFRRQGIATRLLAECEAIVRQRGGDAIGLAAYVDAADPARRLYARLGYVPTGREPYVDAVYNGVADPVLDLVKRL